MAQKRKVPASAEESHKRPRTRANKASDQAESEIVPRPGKVAPVAAPKESDSSRAKPIKKGITAKSVPARSASQNIKALEKSTLKTSRASKDQGTNSETTKEATRSEQELGQEGTDEVEKGDGRKQYWLMKAEPEDRFENGHNVKFSIDDLEAATKPEPWDGVRNYVARNNMIAMKEGDLAFFYHSNCALPGIVGIMRIVQEHTVDESAFDVKHPYFDPKSKRDKPRWELVHVGFVKKFNEKISLKEIQQNAASTKELVDMDLLKYKRLSVTAVKPDEWDFIIKWAGEPADIGTSAG